ncbi:MAG: SpoIIE family protein phosphatase [Desulfohalobiaceae bacterium]|nr:SpoIIE family protein phosphatase [Desulfohalobiaceae bacterium]
MKIRSKFSLLGIILVILPLVTVTYFQHSSMTKFGTSTAEHTSKMLLRKERALLNKIVQDYSAILQRDKMTHERALRLQKREVERLLSSEPPESPKIHFPQSFRKGATPLPGLSLDYKHMRQMRRMDRSPIWVNYSHQVLYLPPGTEREEAARDLARLSRLSGNYRFIYRLNPEHILWQHTVLESGIQSTYPGHARFPSDYDPRNQPWYKKVKQDRSMVRVVSKEPATGAVNQVVAMPVYHPEGSFAGATAICVPYERAFRDLRFTTMWGGDVIAMLVLYQQDGVSRDRLKVLAHESPPKSAMMDKEALSKRSPLADLDLEAMPRVRQSIASGDSGVHKIRYRGKEILLAHGGHKQGEPFPLILLPYEKIVAKALTEKQTIQQETRKWVLLSGFILLGAIGLSVILALGSARSITRPVLHLANAARRLAQGDFQTKIELDSGDELQELGEIFNDIGPKLEEHKRMSQALEIARKAQYYLLPYQAPKMQDFDICGTSIYSDETGGDYYDFIEMESPEKKKLAIAVGDVSGHGLGAAFLMASARGVIRSHALQYRGNLQDLLRILNSHLVHDSRDDQFLTLFYAVLDPETHSLNWISAGHEPALCYRATTGGVEEVQSSGMPLGITNQAVHEKQRTLVMEAGDILLIGTDGIREARNNSREMFGNERLQKILTENANQTTEEICRRIVDSLRAFCGGAAQEDDITLVAIKYQPRLKEQGDRT